MAWEKEVAYLAEKNAHYVKYTDTPLLFRRELVRGWPRETDALMASAIDYLNRYSTADNGTSPTARSYVDNPKVLLKGGTQSFTGRWRVVHNDKTTYENEAQVQEQSGIVQTLRYGLAQTLEWDEVRIVNNRQSPGNSTSISTVSDTASDDPEDFLLLEFVNLDPDYTRNMVAGIANTVSFTSSSPGYRYGVYPYASGTWHKIAATISESEQGDGSARIQVLLARPQFTLEAYRERINFFTGGSRVSTVYYLWNVPKTLAQTIIDNFKASGRSATASYGGGDNMVNLVLTDTIDAGSMYLDFGASLLNCSTVESTVDIFGVYDPTSSLYSLWANPIAQDPGYTISRNVSLDKSTGKFDISFRIRQALTRNYPWRCEATSETQYHDVYQQFSVSSDAGLFDIRGQEVQGLMYTQAVRIQDDCTRDSSTTATVSVPIEFYIPWYDSLGLNAEYQYHNQRDVKTFDFGNFRTGTVSTTLGSDGTYNQSLTIRPVMWTFSASRPEDAYVEQAYEVAIRPDASTNNPVIKLLVVWAKVFNSAASAATFAEKGDQIMDKEHGSSLVRGASEVKYLGNNKWLGRQVQYKTISTSWDLGNAK